ncbi:MAG: hypothetical protein DRP08_04180, partial [Candidatus Aenigmatarchaeota archaeon]
MVRIGKMADGAESLPYDRDNPYTPRHAPRRARKWYQNKWLIGIAIVVVLFVVLSATDNLKIPGFINKEDNQTAIDPTAELSEQEQLVNYVISQQQAGKTKDEIIQLMTLAGYTEENINTAFILSDPVIQYILTEQ